MRTVSLLLISLVPVISGCDPAKGLENPEYRSYLGSYKRYDVAIVVAAFNQLDTKRGDFSCQSELEAAQRAVWREKVGESSNVQTEEGDALKTCLQDFFASSGVEQGTTQMDVLSRWVNHNFLPPIQKSIDAEAVADRERIDRAGCGGEECEGLTVVGDLVVPRRSFAKALTWFEADGLCDAASTGGIASWRLPTREELTKMRESNKLATDPDLPLHWSAEREFTDDGEIQAWTLSLARGGEDAEPKLIPLLRKGRPARIKVRCVHDLSKAGVAANEVDEMELALEAAGCPTDGWDDSLRLRQGLLVTFKPVKKAGEAFEQTCGELGWCELSWRVPGKAEAKKLAADPWFREGPEERCVATVPGE